MNLTLKQALHQGVEAHKAGRLQDAERFYRAVLKTNPCHPDANHNLAVLAVSLDKVDASLPLFEVAIEANPKIEKFWLGYIEALIKAEKIDKAKKALEQTKKYGLETSKLKVLERRLHFIAVSDSKPPQKHPTMGSENDREQLSLPIELRELGKYKEAQVWLKTFLKGQPDHLEAVCLLSQVLLLDKKEVEAENALQVAESINFEGELVYRSQARLLLYQGKPSEALEKAKLSFKKSPEDIDNLIVLAASLSANKKDAEALPLIEKIIEVKPQCAEAYANRAILRFRSKDVAGAITDAEMSLSLKPHLAQMWSILGLLYDQCNALPKAIKSVKNAHKNERENANFLVQLGELLRKTNKTHESRTFLKKAAVLDPKNEKVWITLGISFQQDEKMADAKCCHQKALYLNPHSVVVFINLGSIATTNEEWESALKYYAKALEIEPNHAEAHYNLGIALGKMERFEEALASYSQAILLKSNFESAFHNKWRLLFEKKEFDEALKTIDFCNSEISRVYSLVTLYAMGRINEIYKRIEQQAELDDENIRMAAFSSFISEVEKKSTAHRFCPNPLSFVYFSNISSHRKGVDHFIGELIEELNTIESTWEPDRRSAVKGFVTKRSINLFEIPSMKLAQLKSIIIEELEAYYRKFQNESCSFIEKWPSNKKLYGWHVVLKKQGYQSAHIHPTGWLSGVIYLKTVPPLRNNEGAIEFRLGGEDYQNINTPSLTHRPSVGDIVLFPSSLHHRTIPFTTETDRIIVSFDLMQRDTSH